MACFDASGNSLWKIYDRQPYFVCISNNVVDNVLNGTGMCNE